jgi:hypothetical protein
MQRVLRFCETASGWRLRQQGSMSSATGGRCGSMQLQEELERWWLQWAGATAVSAAGLLIKPVFAGRAAACRKLEFGRCCCA